MADDDAGIPEGSTLGARTLASRTIFRGRVITLDVDTVKLPNGHDAELEIVRHPGGAAVVAIDERDRVCLLRQYRHAAGGWIWELPAGKLERGEAPLLTAQRELREEGGVTARAWVSLGSYLSSPGVFDEVIHLYLATGIERAESAAEIDEVFEVHWIARADARRQALHGELRDGKTLVALLRVSEDYLDRAVP
jgi:ADP-ribose pyrophosphatase